MKIKPIKKNHNPQYPVRSGILKNPSFISQICTNWNRKIIKTSLLATLLIMMITGCEKDEIESYINQNDNAENHPSYDKSKKLEMKRKEILEFRLLLTPRAIMQPYQLTEEEAWIIIERKAKEVGLDFEHNLMTLDNIVLELDTFEDNMNNLALEEDVKQLKESHSINIDGYDKINKVGIEYIALPSDLSRKELNLEELTYVYQLTDLVHDSLKENHEDKNIKIIIGRTDEIKTVEEALEQELDAFFAQLKEEKIIE